MDKPQVTGTRCQCRECGEYFNSLTWFDKHRTGSYRNNERRCLTPAEIADAGMMKNDKGFWAGGDDD